MCAKPDQPDPRDRVMDHLLAEALQPGASSPGADPPACPDAELVAAYADQGLAENDRSWLEVHFAGCGRCQQVLAGLGLALQAPASASVTVIPAPASAPAMPRPAARPAPSPQRWLWWLSPAFGAAAAALLWMALRPAAPQPVQTAADYSRAGEQETRALNAPVAPSPEPQPPAAAAARRDAQALDRFSKAESAAKETAADTPDQAVAQFAASSADSLQAPPAAPPPAALRSEVATAAAPAPAVPPVPTAQAGAVRARVAPNVTVTEQLPLVNTNSATLGGTLSNQTFVDPPVTARASGQLNLYTYSFTSPEGGVQWRLGAAGFIQKSTDNGQTWQQQAGGVTTDLVAGSAASNEVAWIVGRAAVILRTTDGRQWQRIAPPAGFTGDWVTVVVRSAASATVVGPIRRFSTEDGGMTWTEQR